MLGDVAFNGKGYPKLFMTDDGTAEKNALMTVWPESTQLLCIFHVLQVTLVLNTSYVFARKGRMSTPIASKNILYLN